MSVIIPTAILLLSIIKFSSKFKKYEFSYGYLNAAILNATYKRFFDLCQTKPVLASARIR